MFLHAKMIMEKKFTISQKRFMSLLASMQPICTKRTTLDITESILFQATPRELTLKSTDLEISLQAHVDVESDFTEVMAFLVPGKRVFELVKEFEGDLTCALSDNQMRIQAGGVDVALNIKTAEDFPPFPERIENLMEMDSAFLLDVLNKVAFLIPQNNANNALNGLFLEMGPQEMSMVATDGHSLARITTTKYILAEEKRWLMPKRAVLELKRLLEGNEQASVFLGVCGNQLVFSGKNFNFFTKLIADPFPQYKAVLAREEFIPATLLKDPFLKTLKRANCLLAGQFISTSFDFSPESKVKVRIQNKEVGILEDEVVLEKFDGARVESRFYSPYILNGLQAFTQDRVNFYVKNNTKPIIFEMGTEDYQMTYLVMPVSLTQAE